MQRRTVLVLLMASLVFLSGCILPLFAEMADDPMSHKHTLTIAQRQYTNAIRWRDMDEAARFVHPDVREEFLALADSLDAIRFTEFDVGETVFGPEDASATVRVTYHAYSQKTVVEKVIKETQEWERVGEGNDWFVRPHLAGLLEKVADLK